MRTIDEITLELARATHEYISHTGAETTRKAIKERVLRLKNELSKAHMNEPIEEEEVGV